MRPTSDSAGAETRPHAGQGKPRLSVIIVTWNSAADIENCLDSIAFDGHFEVIIIDNASTDDTVARVRRYKQFILIENKANLGYARANNQGLAIASGQHVLLLNPDTVLGPGALDELCHELDRVPDTGAVAPRLVNPDGTDQDSIRSLPTATAVFFEVTGLSSLFPGNAVLDHWRLRKFDYNAAQDVQQPMASCLLFRRAVLMELGGFDERFPIFYNDVDICQRLLTAGWRIRYLPTVKVMHRRGASTSQVKLKSIRENHRSLFRYLRKHDNSKWFWLKAVWLLPTLELATLVRMMLWRLRGNKLKSR